MITLIKKEDALIITIGHTKGGVGKTTIAVNVAAAAALQGKSVFLIDGDIQDTSLTSITLRNEAGIRPAIAAAQYAAAGQLRSQLPLIRDKYDLIVVDAGGRESAALRIALALTDILIVPFAPRSFDLWALGDIHTLVEEANAIRPAPISAYALLNGADLRGNENAEAAAAMADFPSIQYLNTPICRRKSIAIAAANGLSVLESKPRDEKAIAEFSALFSRLF